MRCKLICCQNKLWTLLFATRHPTDRGVWLSRLPAGSFTEWVWVCLPAGDIWARQKKSLEVSLKKMVEWILKHKLVFFFFCPVVWIMYTDKDVDRVPFVVITLRLYVCIWITFLPQVPTWTFLLGCSIWFWPSPILVYAWKIDKEFSRVFLTIYLSYQTQLQ